MDTLKIRRLRESAICPKRATNLSAGYDLYADIPEQIAIHPGAVVKVPTGIAVQIPEGGHAGFIFARSSFATQYGIVPANCVGVIDADYRGEIFVPLHNTGRESFILRPGDRFAQLVVMPVLTFETQEVEELSDTDRGEGGFGSTGRS